MLYITRGTDTVIDLKNTFPVRFAIPLEINGFNGFGAFSGWFKRVYYNSYPEMTKTKEKEKKILVHHGL